MACRGMILVERPMTILNRGQNAAAEVEGAAGAAATKKGLQQCAASRRRFRVRRFWISSLTGLLIAAGANALASPASPRGMTGGSISHDSLSAGRTTGDHTQFSGLRARRIDSRRDRFFAREDRDRFGEFRRFRRRDRDGFGDGFFPVGDFGDFGWPYWPHPQPDSAAAGNVSDGVDDPGPPFPNRFGRYEPPTVETTPSGVTIVRGPGSHHFPP